MQEDPFERREDEANHEWMDRIIQNVRKVVRPVSAEVKFEGFIHKVRVMLDLLSKEPATDSLTYSIEALAQIKLRLDAFIGGSMIHDLQRVRGIENEFSKLMITNSDILFAFHLATNTIVEASLLHKLETLQNATIGGQTTDNSASVMTLQQTLVSVRQDTEGLRHKWDRKPKE